MVCDRGPIDPDVMISGGYWSSYWYDGRIYGTEIARGLDVFALSASEFLTDNEIAAAGLANQSDIFNPQQQFPVSWPEHPVVGLAYVDQLARDEVLAADAAASLSEALQQAASALEAGEENRSLASDLRRMSRDLPRAERGSQSASRLSALEDVIDGVYRALR